MRRFTDLRGPDTPDELWLLEHEAVFTQGQAGRPEHLLMPGTIPVVASDRGGQVTYHGPGQLVVYVLVDLNRLGIGVRGLVTAIEQAIVDWLGGQGIIANTNPHAPGVYVGDAKIASLGLRIRRGCSYHGLSLNLDLDLAPFSLINPCGRVGQRMTRVVDEGVASSVDTAGPSLAPHLLRQLGLPEPTTWDVQIERIHPISG